MTPKRLKIGIAIGVVFLALVVIAAINQRPESNPSLSLADLTSSESSAGSLEDHVTLEVLSCDISTSGFATARVRLTTDESFSYLEFSGDFVADNGDVIGQGLGNLTDVVAGQTYRTDVIYSLSGDATGGTCHVHVSDAS